MQQLFHSRPWRIGEGVSLFGVLPLLLYLGWVPLGWSLLCGFLLVLLVLGRSRTPHFRIAFGGMGNRNFGSGLRTVLIRFGVCCVILLAVVWVLAPERLFSFPMERPGLYLRVMLFYPLLSVIPQELLFRPFFYARYECLFRSGRVFIVINALAFAWAHLFFGNWVALGGSLLAGFFFAETYTRTRSFYLVCLEHALYGSLVWTAGIGIYFYHAG